MRKLKQLYRSLRSRVRLWKALRKVEAARQSGKQRKLRRQLRRMHRELVVKYPVCPNCATPASSRIYGNSAYGRECECGLTKYGANVQILPALREDVARLVSESVTGEKTVLWEADE